MFSFHSLDYISYAFPLSQVKFVLFCPLLTTLLVSHHTMSRTSCLCFRIPGIERVFVMVAASPSLVMMRYPKNVDDDVLNQMFS